MGDQPSPLVTPWKFLFAGPGDERDSQGGFPGRMSPGTSVGNPATLRLPRGIELRAVVEMEGLHSGHTLYRRSVPIRKGR